MPLMNPEAQPATLPPAAPVVIDEAVSILGVGAC